MDFSDISKFSPEEQAALNFHRANLVNNTYLKHPEGDITTFYGSVVDEPNGKGAMIIPTYWGSQIREVPDAMRFAARSNIKFPIYPTAEDALAAEKRMHDVMEQDIQLFRGTKK